MPGSTAVTKRVLLLFVAFVFLSEGRQEALAAPPSQEALPACQAGDLTFSDAPDGCNDLQVILLIDSSASMVGENGNDNEGLRFFGATEAANILADKYLEAVESGVRDLPELDIAAIHFGSAAPPQFFSGWIRISPESHEAWENEGQAATAGALVPEGVETFIPRVYPATNFILPFQAAAELAGSIEGPDESGCPNRVVLVLTDGAPATSFIFTGTRLQRHMESVREIVQEMFSGPGDEVYVTAISSGEDYWSESRPLWEQITRNDDSGEVARAARVPDAASLAARMAGIIATRVGLEFETREIGTVFIPPFLDSVRISYFAPAAAADLLVTDPDSLPVQPDGVRVLLSGEETAVKVLEILEPSPGMYNLSTTIAGGEIALIFNYSDTGFSFENLSPPLQQFTSGEVLIQVLDQHGRPAGFPTDYAPALQGTLSVPGQSDALVESRSGESLLRFEVFPLEAGSGTVKLQVVGTDRNQQDCLLGAGEISFEVDPVGITASPGTDSICTPSGMPLTLPLQLNNLRTGDPALLSQPIIWDVGIHHSTSSAVSAEVVETGEPGRFLLSVDTQQAGAVTADISASIGSEGAEYPLYKGSFTFDNLVQDRTFAFELTGIDEKADEQTVRINRWFGRISDEPEGLLVLGSRRTGSPDSAQVSITGRFFDIGSGLEVPGIERFMISVLDSDGNTVFGPTNQWRPAEDGRQTITFAAPPLGNYSVSVEDIAAPVSCLIVNPPEGTDFYLLGLHWGTTILLLLLALLVIITTVAGIRWFLCTRAGPLTVTLKEEHELRVAPHKEDTIDLATLTTLLRLVVQEKTRPAIGKLEREEGWLHVFVQVDGFVAKPEVCSDRERPMIQVPENGRVPIHEKADPASDILLRVNRCAYVEVLEELDKWYRVRITLSGYIDAEVAVQAGARFRSCYRKSLSVHLKHEASLQAAPLETKSQELIKLHRPADLMVLEDEAGALGKIAGSSGWLHVQTRLTGFVRSDSVVEESATVVRSSAAGPLQVFEFSGEDGYLLADVFETVPARVVKREGEWCQVEILAPGYVRSSKTGQPSKPYGSDRPDRPAIPESEIKVPACEQEPDNLKIIEGIGPQVEKLLNAHGIWTFEDLAAYEGRTQVIEAWLDEREWEMMTPDTWPEQAAHAAAEDWAGLTALMNRLTAGRPETD